MSRSAERVTCLVGAGLVTDAGLPMSVELVSKLKMELAEASANSDFDAGQRALAELQLAAFRFLNGGIRFQEGILNRDPDSPVNIEQIAIAALELHARMENPIAAYTSGWHQRIVDLEKQRSDLLETFVEFMYAKLNTWLQFKDVEKISYLARLADLCNDGVGMDIFSLNYDLCIETALSRIANKSFMNGFTEDGWRPATLWQEDTTIRLFKLHGSLDWAEDEAYGVCSFQFPRHKDAEDIEGRNRPLLIFGTNHKLSAREPFLSLAYHFSQRVLNTPVFAIIGYSFGDTYINEIIAQGIRTNSRLKIILVSPNPNEQIKKFPLLDHPRVKMIPKKAEEALNKSLLLNEARDLLKDAQHEEPF